MHRHPTKGITYAHKTWYIHAKQLYYIWRIALNKFAAHIQNLYAFRPFVRLHSLNPASYQTILMLSLFSCILFTTFSQAKPIHLAGGGTVELHSDGTITGTCYQKFDLQHYKSNPYSIAEFYVTMPDGVIIRTQCINPDRFVPADGFYSFTGVPDASGKSYEITVHSAVSAKYAGYGTEIGISYGHGSIAQKTSTAGSHQKWTPRMTGWIAIQKASSNPDCSNNNSMYSLEGAVYDIYDSQGSIVDTITTDKKGYGCSHELILGSYKVWERSAPKGYALDTQGHAVDVSAGETQKITLTDTPQNNPIRMVVQKIDADTQTPTGEGAATLAGAEFTLKFYPRESATGEPARTWILKTDEDGVTSPKLAKDSRNVYFAKGDSFYLDSNGKPTMPLGTLTIEETKAPSGYLLNSHDVHTVHITSDNTAEEEVHSYVVPKHKEKVQRGDIRIEKMDKELMSNSAQGDATLEGITFAVVNLNSKAVKTSMGMCEPNQVCARITTANKDGHFIAQTLDKDLPYGQYKIYEESSNDSYLNNGFSAEFDITHDKELVRLTDTNSCAQDSVVRGGIKLGKIDKELNVHKAQGAATLEGAQFSVYNKSKAAVMVDGKLVKSGDLATTITTNKDGYASSSDHCLPYGTYTICETKAPTGYELNSEWSREVKVRKDGTVYDLSSEKESVDDQVQRGSIRIEKIDKELMSNKAQGDATLEGITFAVVNLNSKAVKTSMGMCEPNQVCARITTINKDGTYIAQTSDQELPYGHYRIYEESSNDSYLNNGFSAEFDITKDQELVSLTDANSCAQDSVVRGGIKLGKIDKELNVHTPQGAATLEGAEFSVYNKSASVVKIGDKLVAPNELVTVLKTDKTGCVVTDKRMLPFGTYLVQETKAPTGYELNNAWERYVKILKDSTIYDLSSEKQSVDDQVNRGDIRLIKRDDQTQKPMSGVIFKLTSKTTGETHLLMTDENGEINTSSEYVKHSYKTNQNDSALNSDGTCDATKLVMDTGVWFGGTKDTKDGAKPSDTLGALPYDTYTISELRSPQNKDKKLISFDIHLTRPHYNLILGTLNNKPAESFITELLSTDLTHNAYAEEKTTLTDTLSFENLNVGSTYTVSGYLVDKDTGEPLQDAQGKDIRVEKTFTARIASDRVKLVYTFNAKDLNGKSVVAFATLKDKDGNIICSEKDLDERDQSVSFTNPPKPPVTPPDEPPVCPPTPPVCPPCLPPAPPVTPPDEPPAPPVTPPDEPPVCPPRLPPVVEIPKPPVVPPASPVAPPDVPPKTPVAPPDVPPTPPAAPPDEPPDVPSDTPHESLAKTSDIARIGLGLLALAAGVWLISYGIYRKWNNTHKH